MSRSYKVPVYKNRGMKDIYHRLVKRRIRNYLKSNFLNFKIKTLIVTFLILEQ